MERLIKNEQPVESRKPFTGILSDQEHEELTDRIASELVANLNRNVMEEQRRDLEQQAASKTQNESA